MYPRAFGWDKSKLCEIRYQLDSFETVVTRDSLKLQMSKSFLPPENHECQILPIHPVLRENAPGSLAQNIGCPVSKA